MSKTKEKILREFKKIIEEISGISCINGYGFHKDLENWLSEALDTMRDETLGEAIKLSDEIEAGKETTFEEWRAFKGFRNTLRDKLKTKPKETRG